VLPLEDGSHRICWQLRYMVVLEQTPKADARSEHQRTSGTPTVAAIEARMSRLHYLDGRVRATCSLKTVHEKVRFRMGAV
jgi:hypothetical protein